MHLRFKQFFALVGLALLASCATMESGDTHIPPAEKVDKFSNLIGVYSGHVHYSSDQTINGVTHVTVNGLVETDAGGIHAVPSNEIGYSEINNGNLVGTVNGKGALK